jgi:hypothetical protein
MSLLREKFSLLLALPLRFHDLPGVHERKCVGHVLQRHHLAVSGLRWPERVREPVIPGIACIPMERKKSG